MDKSDLEKILEKQLQLLSERSEKTQNSDYLCKLSEHMSKVADCLCHFQDIIIRGGHIDKSKPIIKETLERQIQLLSEKSSDTATDDYMLCKYTNVMLEVAKQLLPLLSEQE